jgi:hypothetical protein
VSRGCVRSGCESVAVARLLGDRRGDLAPPATGRVGPRRSSTASPPICGSSSRRSKASRRAASITCTRSRRPGATAQLCKAALHNSVQAGLGQISWYHHVALLDKLDDPELRIRLRGVGTPPIKLCHLVFGSATPSAHSSRLVLHGTIRPCLAYLRTCHLARLSCSPIRTRTPRPRRSVRSLTSCSRVPSLSLKASMPLRRCARCASTPTRDPGCHRRLCGRRDRVRYATRPDTREAAPDALISGTHHPKVLTDLARERCARRPPPARSSTGPLDRAPHAARLPDARPDRLPGRDDRDSVRADRGADPPFLP